MNYASLQFGSVPDNAFGIMFHHFHRSGDQPTGQGSITPDQLNDLLGVLDNRLVPAAHWLALHRTGRLTNEIFLTFDDALKCQAQLAAPVLKARGLTGLFFAYTAMLDPTYSGEGLDLELFRYFRCRQFPSVDAFYDAFEAWLGECNAGQRWLAQLNAVQTDQYMSEYDVYSAADRRFRYLRNEILSNEDYRQQMYALMASHGFYVEDLRDILWMSQTDLRTLHDEGHILGLHSHTHPTQLGKLDHEAQAREYKLNKMQLERIVGDTIDVMSHPSNSYNKDTLALMHELGVMVGFRADHQYGFDLSCLELPRVNHSDLMARLELVS